MPSLEYQILDCFYPPAEGGSLREILLRHSQSVRDKALAVYESLEEGPLKKSISPERLRIGSMLHDIGVRYCHAPSIHCMGTEPYLTHGVKGAELLRQYGRERGLDLECYARICERHTGAGLTREEIIQNALPLPERDFLPESAEEKLICFADKFFSKSGSMREKEFDRVLHSMEKFGPAVLERFEALCELFHYGK